MFTLKLDDKTKSEIKKFNDGEETKEMIFVDILDENKYPLRMVLDLEALSSIHSGEYGQSVLVKLINPDQYSKMAELEDLVEINVSEKMEAKELLNGETFFLKLPIKDDKYKFTCPDTMDPTNLEVSPIKPGTNFTVFTKPGVWMNFVNAKAGIYFKIEKVLFDTPKKKTVRVTKK